MSRFAEALNTSLVPEKQPPLQSVFITLAVILTVTKCTLIHPRQRNVIGHSLHCSRLQWRCSLQHPMLCIACGDEDAAQLLSRGNLLHEALLHCLHRWVAGNFTAGLVAQVASYRSTKLESTELLRASRCLTLYTCGRGSDWNTWILSLGGWANMWRLRSGAGGSSQSLKLTLVYQSCDDNIRLIFRSTQSLKLCMFWSLFIKPNLFFVSVYGDFLFHFDLKL